MLTKVIISNFKNIFHLKLEIDKQNFELIAPNAYGKSSIADAIFWVLTGKLLSGSSDIMSIKPKSDTKKLVEVELIFSNGTSLKKTYQEKWTRTRGSTELTLTGHETNCYINGLPVLVSKYDEEILALFGINFKGKYSGNIIQALTDPLYLGLKEDWREFRKLIIDLVGDVTDADVFRSSPDLKILEPHLLKNKGKFEDVKKSFNNIIKGLKEDESKIKAQIDILNQTQTVSPSDYANTVTQLNKIQAQIDDLKSKKYQSEEGAIAERKNQIADMKAKLNELKQYDLAEYNRKFAERHKVLDEIRIETVETRKLLTDLQLEISKTDGELKQIVNQRKYLSEKLKEIEINIVNLRNEWHQVKNQEFHSHDHLNCPNCGYDLNQDLIAKQEEEFQLHKAEKLKEINESGRKLKVQSENIQKEIVDLNGKENVLLEKLEQLKADVYSCNEKIIQLTNKEKEVKDDIPPFTTSQEIKVLEEQIRALELTPIETTGTDYTAEINDLTAQKEPLQAIINTYHAEKMNLKKAQELQNQLEEVVKNIANTEYQAALLNEFIKVKLELLHDRVANVFGDINFQLVESNIKEGSWNEVCWVLDGDVPYYQTNSASKIKLGIKVCEAIRKHLDIHGLPYIIDNAEQITDRNFSHMTDDQTISFVAQDVQFDYKFVTHREQPSLFDLEG